MAKDQRLAAKQSKRASSTAKPASKASAKAAVKAKKNPVLDTIDPALPNSPAIGALIDLALSEDLGQGDLTSEITVRTGAIGKARILARETLVVCGLEIVERVFRAIDARVTVKVAAQEGEICGEETTLVTLEGPLRSLLAGERTALNFLQRLCGVATITRSVVEAAEGLMVLDTRKTIPGWRLLDKYAVRCGGGCNHRGNLSDLVLIKNNHIDANGGDVGLTMLRALNGKPPYVPLEVEVRDEEELRAALPHSPDIILLDNMDDREMARAVKIIREASPFTLIEASGGITLERLATIAKIGVDGVSLGALTNSAPAVDISMRISAK